MTAFGAYSVIRAERTLKNKQDEQEQRLRKEKSKQLFRPSQLDKMDL